MKLVSKLPFVLKVMRSCKNEEQLASAILWAAKVLSKGDKRLLAHYYPTVPSFDIALQVAKERYLTSL